MAVPPRIREGFRIWRPNLPASGSGWPKRVELGNGNDEGKGGCVGKGAAVEAWERGHRGGNPARAGLGRADPLVPGLGSSAGKETNAALSVNGAREGAAGPTSFWRVDPLLLGLGSGMGKGAAATLGADLAPAIHPLSGA
uniref:p0483E09.1 protein n=1 Tax=Oryza sativa subsp. japonica TaxID=39947 RepID=Q84ZI9_ORYSJ|nr:P0483E09.1 [Oryza sativa Japonica Group]